MGSAGFTSEHVSEVLAERSELKTAGAVAQRGPRCRGIGLSGGAPKRPLPILSHIPPTAASITAAAAASERMVSRLSELSSADSTSAVANSLKAPLSSAPRRSNLIRPTARRIDSVARHFYIYHRHDEQQTTPDSLRGVRRISFRDGLEHMASAVA